MRRPRLTMQQRRLVREPRRDGRKLREIATQVGCDATHASGGTARTKGLPDQGLIPALAQARAVTPSYRHDRRCSRLPLAWLATSPG